MRKDEFKCLSEVRSMPVSEIRANGDGDTIAGHAAVFDVETDIGYFREIVRPGAFKRALEEQHDVRALFNHDEDLVLGRTRNGTLRLSEDSHGLSVEIDPPNTQSARDVVELIRRGDVTNMSYAFVVTEERWVERKGEAPLREVLDLDLYDVSVVTYPAEKTTSVGLRSAESVYNDHLASLELQKHKGELADNDESQKRKDYRRRARLATISNLTRERGN